MDKRNILTLLCYWIKILKTWKNNSFKMVTKQAVKDAFLYQDISTWITQPHKEIIHKQIYIF